MAPRGELENRDRDEGMGDLPEDLELERGESFSTGNARSDVPTDMRTNAVDRADAAAAPLGSPSLDFDVRSVYDSRPVNEVEFNEWFTLEGLDGAPIDAAAVALLRRAFLVPVGFVAVVRGVTVLVPNDPTITEVWDGELSIMVNATTVDPPTVTTIPATSAAQINRHNILFRDGEQITTFVIADQNQYVGVDISLVTDIALTTDNFAVGFYGNFLQKTNIPPQFQIANLAGSKGPMRTLPPATRGGMPKVRRPRVPFPRVPIIRGK